MTVLVEESHDLPLVDIAVVTAYGSAHDPPGKEGLARHTLELMRRGAAAKTRAEIDDAFDGLGAEVGPIYHPDGVGMALRCLSRNVEPVLALLSDVLFRPTLSSDEHARLQREGLAAIDEMREDDVSVAYRFFDRYALWGHPYGRTGLGTPASVEALTRADAAAWAERGLHRDTLLWGFAGDVDTAHAEAALSAALAAAPARGPLPEPLPPVERSARRTLLIDKPDRAQAHVIIGHAAPPPSHPDELALFLGATAFGGTFTSRLVAEVRVKRGWSYSVGCRISRARNGHTFRLRVVPAADRAADTLALVLDLLQAFAAEGPDDDEIDHARSYLAKSHAFEVATASDRLDRRLEQVLWALPPDHHQTFVSRLAAVTPDEVRAAVKRWVRPDAATVVVLASSDAIHLPGAEVLPYDSY